LALFFTFEKASLASSAISFAFSLALPNISLPSPSIKALALFLTLSNTSLTSSVNPSNFSLVSYANLEALFFKSSALSEMEFVESVSLFSKFSIASLPDSSIVLFSSDRSIVYLYVV